MVFDVKTHAEVGRAAQPSPFCPNIAATPDGTQVWYTLKDTGKTVVINARPPFNTLTVIDTGPITNHVNFADTARGRFAYVHGRRAGPGAGCSGATPSRRWRRSRSATCRTACGPRGDGTRVYVGLENQDAMAAIDTATNTVIATIPIGQAAQAVTYVPGAVPSGDGREGLQPLGLAGEVAHVSLGPPGGRRRDQRQPVRPGAGADPRSRHNRPAAEIALCARPGGPAGRRRKAAAAVGLHHQPRRGSDRQTRLARSASWCSRRRPPRAGIW
ncbi:MAG: hypothetical protein WDM85_09345 [Caulobacteraceae bacterium]